MQNPRLGPRGSLEAVNAGVEALWAGVAARGQQRPASHGKGVAAPGLTLPLPPTAPQQPLPCLGTHVRECVFKAPCPAGTASLVWSGTPRRGVAGSTDHRGGLKSPGWDLLPAQPISCITRVLPPGHSDPQLLFGQVEPTAACPPPHSAVSSPLPPTFPASRGAPSLSLPQPPSRCWDMPRSSHLRTSAVGALQLEQPPTPGLHTAAHLPSLHPRAGLAGLTLTVEPRAPRLFPGQQESRPQAHLCRAPKAVVTGTPGNPPGATQTKAQ